MYKNENNFTKDPFEDNGRFKIHPLSSEGMEAYLSKDSYNYNYIKTKKNPELLKEIEDEIKAENALKQQILESKNKKDENEVQNKQEDLKEEKCAQNNKVSGGSKGNKSKNKKGKNSNMNKNNYSQSYLNKNKGAEFKYGKKNDNKRKQSPGSKLANTIEKMGKIPGPVISNVNNDRGKLWEYPAPYHA